MDQCHMMGKVRELCHIVRHKQETVSCGRPQSRGCGVLVQVRQKGQVVWHSFQDEG